VDFAVKLNKCLKFKLVTFLPKFFATPEDSTMAKAICSSSHVLKWISQRLKPLGK
jgi:hypothetical protein